MKKLIAGIVMVAIAVCTMYWRLDRGGMVKLGVVEPDSVRLAFGFGGAAVMVIGAALIVWGMTETDRRMQ